MIRPEATRSPAQQYSLSFSTKLLLFGFVSPRGKHMSVRDAFVNTIPYFCQSTLCKKWWAPKVHFVIATLNIHNIMEGPPVPSTMFAWRKYKGNFEPVGIVIQSTSSRLLMCFQRSMRRFLYHLYLLLVFWWRFLLLEVRWTFHGHRGIVISVPECLNSSIQIADGLQVCHSDWSLLKTERNFPHYHDVYTLVSVSTSHCFFVELHLVEHW